MSKSNEFEKKYTDIETLVKEYGYTVNKKTNEVTDINGNIIGGIYTLSKFWKHLLKSYIPELPNTKQEARHFLDAKFNCELKEPDNSFFNRKTNELIILEAKYQKIKGSAHEKIRAVKGLLWSYNKLAKLIPTVPKVKIIYIVNEYLFENYKFDFEYLKDECINYYIEELPKIEDLGL